MGHLTRATALARGLLQLSYDHSTVGADRVTVVTNTSFAASLPVENELGPRAKVIRIDPQLTREETIFQVQRVFANMAMCAVIVDTFPRGIAGELPGILPRLTCRKVLVHRDLNPDYCQQYQLADFVKIYDRLIVPGESALFANLPNAISTPPWLIRNVEELLTPEAARSRLAVTQNRPPVAVVLGCGRGDEIEQMHGWAIRLAQDFVDELEVRFVVMEKIAGTGSSEKQPANFRTISIWPFFEAIRGASIVISGGGYNSVNEARVAGVPFCGVPRKRLYDRQEKRISSSECVECYEEIRSRVDKVVSGFSAQPTGEVSFRNGIQQAVNAIRSVVE